MTHPDDQGHDDLARALRPTSGSPADIDARIRARAREAVAPHPAASLRPRRASGLRAPWAQLLPIAAVVVLAIGILPFLSRGERPVEATAPIVAAERFAESADTTSAALVDGARSLSDDSLQSLSRQGGAGASADAPPTLEDILNLWRNARFEQAEADFVRWRALQPIERPVTPDWPAGLDEEALRWLDVQQRRWLANTAAEPSPVD